MKKHTQLKMVSILGACLLATLAAGWPTNSPSATTEGTSITPKVDINKTILEVEKILDKYPELPRIERSEILTILQNITEEDNIKLKEELAGVLEEEKKKLQKAKEEIPKTEKQKNRSVMVVLPFQADDSEESLEELYTRSPIVLMEEEKERKVMTTTPITTTSTEPTSTEPPAFSIIEKEDPKFNPPLRIIGYRYHTTTSPLETSTAKTYLNYQNPEQVTMAFRAQETKGGKVWNHKDDPPEIIFNEDIKPEWESDPSNEEDNKGFHPPEGVNSFSFDDAWVPKDIEKLPKTTTKPPTTTRLTVTTTVVPTTQLNDLVFFTEEPTTPRMFITPMTPKVDVKEKEILKPHTEPARKKHRTKPKLEKTTKAPKTDNIASVVETLPLDMKNLLSNLGLNSKSITSTTTTEAPKRHRIPSINAEIDPSSYLKFKPLPIKRQKTISDDMQEFLASYGLFDGIRHQKAVQPTTELNDKFLESAPEINTDMLSDSMKKTLESLGLYDKPGVPAKEHIFNPSNHTSVQTEEEIKKLNALLNTIKKLASLNDTEPVTQEFQNEILQQVQELDNITTSYKTSLAINEEIHKIMERNKGKFKIPVIMNESTASGNLNNGPDPEFFEEIQLKNEVKRQEDNTTAEEAEATSSTSTTEEPANSPDLEGAFGGGETASADSDPAESLPPKRPNGLYLLLDWNTFFEVGTDDDARRVNIRFQPKVGDSRNFLPVSIP